MLMSMVIPANISQVQAMRAARTPPFGQLGRYQAWLYTYIRVNLLRVRVLPKVCHAVGTAGFASLCTEVNTLSRNNQSTLTVFDTIFRSS